MDEVIYDALLAASHPPRPSPPRHRWHLPKAWALRVNRVGEMGATQRSSDPFATSLGASDPLLLPPRRPRPPLQQLRPAAVERLTLASSTTTHWQERTPPPLLILYHVFITGRSSGSAWWRRRRLKEWRTMVLELLHLREEDGLRGVGA